MKNACAHFPEPSVLRKCSVRPSADREWIKEAAEGIFGLSVEAEFKRGPEWSINTIAAEIARHVPAGEEKNG